ncbi:MAG: KH domain-containing protein [Eggerthellaceae bacterium]|nr:KH domain-containing protein [Eggerthellaceae bacterium]
MEEIIDETVEEEELEEDYADGVDEIEEDADEPIEEETDDDMALSDEQLDEIADTAIAALKDVLKYFNVGEVTIDEYEGDEGELILDITGDDLAVLIGRHGKTLDALQFLISAITVRKIGFRFPVIIDVESYKNRQRQKLESLARSSAKKAAAQGHSVKLRPMTPYERRIIHMALRDDPRVETASEGEGSGRHVVVVPVK